MKQGCNPLKYACFQPEIRNQMLEMCTDPQIKTHINHLYDLIFYQMKEIDDYRAKILAIKHQNAWNQYNIPENSKTQSCNRKCGGC